jgi:protein-S-isoprenylcysteine O-methyltransferase Ste14
VRTIAIAASRRRNMETMMTTAASDRANVLVFPPVLVLSALLLGLVMQWLIPLGGLVRLDVSWRAVTGAILFVAGALLLPGAAITLERGGTTVHPGYATTALVTRGPFRWTRNPIYVGGNVALVGLALAFALDWVLVFWAANLPLFHYGIVLREEAYLERKFGEPYRRYRTEVRRYVWPFR